MATATVPLWVPLASSGLAAFIGIAGTVLGSVVQARLTDRRWRQEHRTDTYAQVLVSGSAFALAAGDLLELDGESDPAYADTVKAFFDHLHEADVAAIQAQLVAPRKLQIAISQLHRHVLDTMRTRAQADPHPTVDEWRAISSEYHRLARNFIMAARVDLGSE
jgi:hypothetical protein